MAWKELSSNWLIYNTQLVNFNDNNIYLRRDELIMKLNVKKLIINSLLLAVGLILHEITPPIFMGMKPDLALIMLFIVILINDDYQTALTSGIVCGILTALTTGFPNGQVPNIIDKIVTSHAVYLMLLPIRNKLNAQVKAIFITIIGTIISGSVFLGSAAVLAGLPGGASFTALFIAVVLPATIFNAIGGVILYNIINLSLKRSNSKVY